MARLSLLLYCRKRLLYCKSLINLEGPAIIASNHHNSMMDAAIVGAYCKRPVHYIVRSDMFNKKLLGYLLRKMNGIPVYRQSEEKEKLRENRSSIEMCKNVLKEKGIILIFSEGLTEHNWQLKPVKSGTARIVKSCMEDEWLKQNLKVLPSGITYSNYDRLAKTIVMLSADHLVPGQLDHNIAEGEWRKKFNQQLESGMRTVAPQMHSHSKSVHQLWKFALLNCYKIPGINPDNAGKMLESVSGTIQHSKDLKHPAINASKYLHYSPGNSNLLVNYLLFLILLIPAATGFLLNGPYYFPIRSFAFKKTRGSIFFDSVFFGLLTFLYPLYVLPIGALIGLLCFIPFWAWWLIIPISGWCTVEWFSHCMAIINSFRWPAAEKKLANSILGLKSTVAIQTCVMLATLA